MKTDFSSPVATAEFCRFAGILSAALSQHHLLGFEIAQLEWISIKRTLTGLIIPLLGIWMIFSILLGGRNDNPLQSSCMENSIDRGAWRAIVHGVTKSRTRLRD